MTENGDPLHPRPAVEVVSESRSFILESDAISYVLRARRGAFPRGFRGSEPAYSVHPVP